MNVIGIIKGLKAFLNRNSSATASSVPPATPVAPVPGRAAPGPQQRETRSYEIGHLENGYIETNVEIVQKTGSTLDVHILERAIGTANGTIVKKGQLKLICGVCSQPSERELYCQQCSMPLCIRDCFCVRIPDTGEVLRLCPSCAARLYSSWNPWRGKLPAPFSITTLDRTPEKTQ